MKAGELKKILSNEVLLIGDSKKLLINKDIVDLVQKKYTWNTSNPTVATIDQSGVVTALSEGFTIISIHQKRSKIFAKCLVAVKAPNKKVEESSDFIDSTIFISRFAIDLRVIFIEELYSEIQLINTVGKILISTTVKGDHEIVLSPSYESAPKGVYYLRVSGKGGNKITKVVRE